MARLILLSILQITFFFPAANAKQKKKKTKKRLNHWSLQLSASFWMFGPVTYDRLAVFSGSGEARRDPALNSFRYSLKLEEMLHKGGWYVMPFWRQYQEVNNTEEGKYSDTREVGFSRSLKIRSFGPGLALGWSFRRRELLSNHWFPHIGLFYERNSVFITGLEEESELDPLSINLTSELNVVYSTLGLGWRFFASKEAEIELELDIAIPLFANQNDSPTNDAERSISKKLRHGARGGAGFGLAIGILQ